MADTTTHDPATGRRPRAAFHAMAEGTKADWDIIAAGSIESAVGLPDRTLAHLRELGGDFGGFAVDRLEHSLQTASRAHRADRDDEYVFCALMHDIGDLLAPSNHAGIGGGDPQAVRLRAEPLDGRQHGIFQGYYFFHHLGPRPRHARAVPRPPYFDYTAEFCATSTSPRSTPATTPPRSSTSSRWCARSWPCRSAAST